MIQSSYRPAPLMTGSAGLSNGIADQNKQSQAIDSLHLILFSVGGVLFGIDADNVTEIATCNGDEEDLLWIHKELGYGGRDVRYVSPTILSIKADSGTPYQLVIDDMKDITEFNLEDIKPFPALLEPFALRYGLWGIIPRRGVMTLLLDCQLLCKQRSRNSVSEP